jgi:hypothetical protein
MTSSLQGLLILLCMIKTQLLIVHIWPSQYLGRLMPYSILYPSFESRNYNSSSDAKSPQARSAKWPNKLYCKELGHSLCKGEFSAEILELQ